MKKAVVCLMSAVLLCAFVLSNAFAKEAAPKDMVLKAPAGVAAKQAPVAFSHAKHGTLDCKACHHKWDGKGKVGGCLDKGCHDLTTAATPAEKKDPKYFYNAFHNRTNKSSCVGCHSETKKAKADTKAPVGCQDCHKK